MGDKYTISQTMEPGSAIVARNHGSFCCYCGDYYRHKEEVEALMTATGGCQRCNREGQHLKIRKDAGMSVPHTAE